MFTEFACGQILFNVKNSNLHYLINKTHLSVHITLRKKFIKHIEEVENITATDDMVDMTARKKLIEKIKMENGLLKQENSDFKTNFEMIQLEN